MKRYASRNTAERMGSLASRNAYTKGEYSQYAMVRPVDGGMYHVGPVNEVQVQWPNAQILVQWSGGYRV
jgi:hypothetical protein